MSYIYIASPYISPDPKVQEDRHDWAIAYACSLIETGHFPFSPIVHCHPLAEKANLPYNFEYWESYNFAMLFAARELHVLCLDGWVNSTGVQAEIRFARLMQKPTRFAKWNPSLEIFSLTP